MSEDAAEAMVVHGSWTRPDGTPVSLSRHGWWYYDANYPDEGSVGPFDRRRDAESHARSGGYVIPSPRPADEENERSERHE